MLIAAQKHVVYFTQATNMQLPDKSGQALRSWNQEITDINLTAPAR